MENLKEIKLERTIKDKDGKESVIEEVFVVKKLKWGEINQLRDECMDVKIIGGQPVMKLSQAKLREVSLLKGLVKAPFEININNIRNMEAQVGDTLYEEYDRLNSPEDKKKDTSEEQSTDT